VISRVVRSSGPRRIGTSGPIALVVVLLACAALAAQGLWSGQEEGCVYAAAHPSDC
jgi:hypothetical protein